MSIHIPSSESIAEAARVIREGGVVVMPTETVYGLACDALNDRAVARVFELKGRPNENPLIVHIAGLDDLPKVAESWPPIVEKLAERFWPGPLTMVLPKLPSVPFQTTGGLDTVAVRVPDHDVALVLIEESERPLAAPSANPFGRLSPTRAEDVDPELAAQVPMVLDGGPCRIGLESTVLDLTSDEPRVLRPGSVSRADIQAVLGRPLGSAPPPAARKSPGLYQRHYAPRAAVVLAEALTSGQAGLTFGEPCGPNQVRMPLDPRAYAAQLYNALQRLDAMGVDEIRVVLPPRGEAWEAVHDRLKKASAS
ncbi:MAG: threonylcarbamoyl-AMP synthase [Fimbriimonadaceae bacterium]|nr:threonylcarbamoyl-AMP synthase [Fimbriimonadaceae bacterium]QYK57380.1 MAG: threonylcarbamoyl-AMP synthase [Fimbriimonadaceae bacterium]